MELSAKIVNDSKAPCYLFDRVLNMPRQKLTQNWQPLWKEDVYYKVNWQWKFNKSTCHDFHERNSSLKSKRFLVFGLTRINHLQFFHDGKFSVFVRRVCSISNYCQSLRSTYHQGNHFSSYLQLYCLFSAIKACYFHSSPTDRRPKLNMNKTFA